MVPIWNANTACHSGFTHYATVPDPLLLFSTKKNNNNQFPKLLLLVSVQPELSICTASPLEPCRGPVTQGHLPHSKLQVRPGHFLRVQSQTNHLLQAVGPLLLQSQLEMCAGEAKNHRESGVLANMKTGTRAHTHCERQELLLYLTILHIPPPSLGSRSPS